MNDQPPGTFSDRFLKRAESTMNATIREAVMVSAHLDSGAVNDCLDALIQIRLNAEQVISAIERRLKGVKS